MASTYTPELVLGLFQQFCSAFGLPIADATCAPGTYAVEYVKHYGGWRVIQYTERGGEVTPFGQTRRNHREVLQFPLSIPFEQERVRAARAELEPETIKEALSRAVALLATRTDDAFDDDEWAAVQELAQLVKEA